MSVALYSPAIRHAEIRSPIRLGSWKVLRSIDVKFLYTPIAETLWLIPAIRINPFLHDGNNPRNSGQSQSSLELPFSNG